MNDELDDKAELLFFLKVAAENYWVLREEQPLIRVRLLVRTCDVGRIAQELLVDSVEDADPNLP